MAVCTAASAQTYELRTPMKTLLVQGSPAPSTGSSTPTAPTTPALPAPVYSAQLTTSSLDFGSVAVGQPGVQSFGVLNTGNQPLNLGAITASDAAFSAVTSCAAPLAPGDQCPVQVTFRPTAGQAYSGTVSINANVSNSPLVVTLAGTGLQAVGVLSANTSSDFGQVTVGQSASRTFTLTNNGNAAATNVVASVAGSNGLALTNNTCGTSSAPTTVQAGGTCTMTVTYTPAVAETLSRASLSVASSAVSSPNTLNLTGSSAMPSDANWANVSLLMHMESLTDSSSLHRTVTATTGAAITSTAQKFGANSLYLNGAGYLTATNSTAYAFGTGDFTVEFWLNSPIAWTSQSGSSGIIGMKTSDSTNGWVIYRNTTQPNKLAIRITGTSDCYSASAPSTGAWDHWAVTRQGTTVRWFKNGVLDASCTNGANVSDTAPLYIGYAQTWGGYGKLYLDDIRITKGVARYVTGFTPPTAAFPDQ